MSFKGRGPSNQVEKDYSEGPNVDLKLVALAGKHFGSHVHRSSTLINDLFIVRFELVSTAEVTDLDLHI